MWYEMIPAAFLSGGLLCVPYLVIPYINEYCYGNVMHKKFDTPFSRKMLLRDQRIKGCFYNKSTLDEIPD